jgi:hypothetical protein
MGGDCVNEIVGQFAKFSRVIGVIMATKHQNPSFS